MGVRCRAAPSTSAIMRSRNESPAAAVTRTSSTSDSTRVPPVTPLRSPPASRTTGALSPVMADSSTEATPSTTSPSAGINSPALMMTRSPARSRVDDTDSVSPAGSRRKDWRVPAGTTAVLATRSRTAGVSCRVLRRLSAWALPRASASASAKLANSTVASSQPSRASR